MKKLLLLLPLTFLPLPASAITWGEFWAPFTYERGYYPPPRYYNPPMCRKRVYREEYYPPTRWEPGYIRSWYEWITVPCYE